MNKDNIPFLQPPLGGMGQQQRYIEENSEEHHYQRQRHRHRTHGVTGTMRAQVLRSSAKWSSGIELEVNSNKLYGDHYSNNIIFLAFYSKCLYCNYSFC